MLDHVKKKQPIEFAVRCGQHGPFDAPEIERRCPSLGSAKRRRTDGQVSQRLGQAVGGGRPSVPSRCVWGGESSSSETEPPPGTQTSRTSPGTGTLPADRALGSGRGAASSGGRRVSIEIAGVTLAAVYEREVAASLERIWENVLDWEHLPWLHRDSFVGIREVEAGPEGWRACVLLPQPGEPSPAWIEVCLDRAQLRYVTRTLAGLGKGTEIWTRLNPVADRATHITVEFHLPGVTATRGARERDLGTMYTQLYTRLWNEDEGMMIRRQALLDARGAPVTADAGPFPLGPASALRAQLPRVVDAYGARFRIVEIAGELRAHATVCPHRGGPLEDAMPDAEGCIVCPWHGYRFDLQSGKSADGRRLGLSAAPAVLESSTGEACLVWPSA